MVGLLPTLSLSLASLSLGSLPLETTSPQGTQASLQTATLKSPTNAVVPGQQAGTQVYIVHFKEREFDLANLQRAYRDGSTAHEIAQIVAGLEQAAEASQADFEQFVETMGGRIAHHYWIINACSIEIDPSHIEDLSKHPQIADVRADQWRRPGRMIKKSTNAQNHGTDAAQSLGYLGANVAIAIVDSGIDIDTNGQGRAHRTFHVDGDPNKPSRILANYQMGSMSPDDVISHGTGVAAVAAGESWNTTKDSDRGHAPRANIVNYSIADSPNGYTRATVLINTWQRLAATAKQHGISVANCSYEGFSRVWGDQQALDAMVIATGVVVCGMAGNGGGSNSYTYEATNMIAVGAVSPDFHKVAPFSSRGPLRGSRIYPDLVANGVDMRVPAADSEATNKLTQGTSLASPQAAGAALLYRSIRPASSAAEVKAALLASATDISAQNQVAPYNTANAYGNGYLNVPKVISTALGHQELFKGTARVAIPTTNFMMNVTKGDRYGVALVWFREVANQWISSELNLEVRIGNTVIASSTNPLNNWEHLRFTATASGTAKLVVNTISVSSVTGIGQDYALAAVNLSRNTGMGSLTAYGDGCKFMTLRPDTGSSPQLGGFYTMSTTAGTSLAHLLIGASKQKIGNLALPFDLSVFGAPSCELLTSNSLSIPIPANTGGYRSISIAVPNAPVLIGAHVYHQAIINKPGQNQLGWLFTNGVDALIDR